MILALLRQQATVWLKKAVAKVATALALWQDTLPILHHASTVSCDTTVFLQLSSSEVHVF